MKSGFRLALALIPVLAHAAFVGAGTPRFTDPECMKCHESGLELGFHSVPRVQRSDLDASVHSGMACVECHEGIRSLPHDEALEPVDCGVCHGKEYDRYADSVHGLAYVERGELEAPTCADCHGKHRILSHLDPGSTVFRSEIPRTCANCHENMAVVEKYHIRAESPWVEYQQSAHGKALLRDGLINFAAVCTDCHGIHTIEGEGTGEVSARRPDTCGRCHLTIYAEYRESIHGVMYLEEGNRDVPVCVDCHGEHTILSPGESASSVSPENIANTCSSCHESEKMKRYDISSDKLKTYRESYHGVAREFGSVKVANCASCHGYHDIRPSSDPASSIHVDNLPKTCGKCHTRTSENFARGKVHIDIESRGSGRFYYTRMVFLRILAGLVVVSAIWLFVDVRRKMKQKRSG
jgi:nitrate/TMAO reductase-like tetraheme cytochrome c subunit